ncbi:MAG: hypothetical protein IPF49_09285 [Gammaproteobacteria bacterium]|nr:hypothetical protein [Gammaproteobacteria bacterium]
MEKYLLLLGFQLTQTAFLGAIDGSAWRALAERGIAGALRDLDPDAFRLLFQTLISGTWIGRIADLGDMALAMARGAEGLPLALIALQWVAVVLWLAAERMVFERRGDEDDAGAASKARGITITVDADDEESSPADREVERVIGKLSKRHSGAFRKASAASSMTRI